MCFRNTRSKTRCLPWEKNLKKNGCVYMYKYTADVNQLYFHKTLKLKKKKQLSVLAVKHMEFSR